MAGERPRKKTKTTDNNTTPNRSSTRLAAAYQAHSNRENVPSPMNTKTQQQPKTKGAQQVGFQAPNSLQEGSSGATNSNDRSNSQQMTSVRPPNFNFDDVAALHRQIQSKYSMPTSDHSEDDGSIKLLPINHPNPIPDRSQSDTSEDENLVQHVNNLQPFMFDLDLTDKTIRKPFEKEAAYLVYTSNAFPNLIQSQQAASTIGFRYFRNDADTDHFDYIASDELRSAYRKMVTARRSSSNKQVGEFILKLRFLQDMFPPQYAGDKDSQDRYMLGFARFARSDYAQDGILLESPLLSQTIHHVFFNKRGQAGHRLSPTPEFIAAPLIVLVYVMLYFNFAKTVEHPLYLDHDQFSVDSYWSELYFDTLNAKTTDAALIGWKSVCQYHTKAIKELQGKKKRGEWTTDMAISMDCQVYRAHGSTRQ